MGWNAVSVQEGVESHITEEKTEMHLEEPKRIFVEEMKRRAEEEKRRRHRQREQIYADNLDILMRETGNNISSISMPTRLPIDSYDVYCEKLEGQWKKHDFTIDIEKTATPGLLEAAFDFGVVEGIMIICGSQSRLKECRDRAYRGKNPYQYPFPEVNDDLSNAFSSSSSGSSSNPSGGDSGVSNGKHHQPGSKRKSEDERPTTEIKGAKKGQGLPYKYPLMLRCREMYQQEILYNPEMGKTMFKDGNFDCFTGIVNLPDDFGRNVVFYALKVSHEPQSFNKQWSDYSEEQWEFECRDRYRRR
ncbi:hypothetical protein N7481_009606 [Penicillium waksmanii]|uniref:uncharacterized protein n=1 Tax=Penicillium waksmanii TaxID=69791 RepID=UPI0025475DC2|nr:uncharacterized protein N7481_009606 [Penicillium waksmanii]KAJ5975899.1 hypothetical protein N7481_009606 [Penicillium waksmanii]